MSNKIFFLVFFSLFFIITGYSQKTSFLIVPKGIYIDYEKKDKKLKVPFKENEEFFFSLKNDTTALVQDIKNHKLLPEVSMKVSKEIYTGYSKSYSVINGKKRFVYKKTKYKKVTL